MNVFGWWKRAVVDGQFLHTPSFLHDRDVPSPIQHFFSRCQTMTAAAVRAKRELVGDTFSEETMLVYNKKA